MKPDVDTSLLAELVRDTRSKHGRLSHTGRPEQHRYARRHQIRGDHLTVTVATEEKQRVDGGVFERRQTLVRGEGNHEFAHAVARASSMPAYRARTPAYCSSGSSCTSTSRLLHN